ncbi:hypothetical protein [Propioniciclava flava]
MTRQKCVINALAKQANPVTVATRFTALAEAGGAMVTTDIPGSEVSELLELAVAGALLAVGVHGVPPAAHRAVPPRHRPDPPHRGR